MNEIRAIRHQRYVLAYQDGQTAIDIRFSTIRLIKMIDEYPRMRMTIELSGARPDEAEWSAIF